MGRGNKAASPKDKLYAKNERMTEKTREREGVLRPKNKKWVY